MNFIVPVCFSTAEIDALKIQFKSCLDQRAIRYQQSIEWDSTALKTAQDKVLSCLKDWKGTEPIEFVFTFTLHQNSHLHEIVYIRYFIENQKPVIKFSECLPEVHEALTAPKITDYLDYIAKYSEPPPPSVIVITYSPINLRKFIKAQHYANFTNPLDRPPTLTRFNLTDVELPLVAKNVSILTAGCLYNQKKTTSPMKLIFSLAGNITFSLKTTRIQGMLKYKAANTSSPEAKRALDALIETVEKEGFKILYSHTIVHKVTISP